MPDIEHWLEARDFSALFWVLSVLAIIFLIELIQFSWHNAIAPFDPIWLQHARRFGMFLLVATIFWSWSYAQRSGWQPWPCYVGFLIALDFWLFVSVISAVLRRRRAEQRKTDVPIMSRGDAARAVSPASGLGLVRGPAVRGRWPLDDGYNASREG